MIEWEVLRYRIIIPLVVNIEEIENERACYVQIYSTRGLIRTREKC